jgi:hypothetical protein
MLQHRAALCQPIHARLAHFAPSFASQFPHQSAAPPRELTSTTPGTALHRAQVSSRSSHRHRLHAAPETAAPIVKRGSRHLLALDRAGRAPLAIRVRTLLDGPGLVVVATPGRLAMRVVESEE